MDKIRIEDIPIMKFPDYCYSPEFINLIIEACEDLQKQSGFFDPVKTADYMKKTEYYRTRMIKMGWVPE